jgi:hypothetical protein
MISFLTVGRDICERKSNFSQAGRLQIYRNDLIKSIEKNEEMKSKNVNQ